MEQLKNFEKIADYAWMKKGRKYWNLWIGNPFMISKYTAPVTIPKEEILADVAAGQAKAKQEFIKNFPDVEWIG
jgi:hypothetical protein